MEKIEVNIIDSHCPTNVLFLGAKVCYSDLDYYTSENSENLEKISRLLKSRHSIIRLWSITILITGLSQRARNQLRTHSTGFTMVSSSQQYRAHKTEDIVTPDGVSDIRTGTRIDEVIENLEDISNDEEFDNDQRAYYTLQAQRGNLLIQGNLEAWLQLLEQRLCVRNTLEVRMIAMAIKKKLADCVPDLFEPYLPQKDRNNHLKPCTKCGERCVIEMEENNEGV